MQPVVTDTTDNPYFAKYFHERADLAEELHRRGFGVDGKIIATTALDALAEVWLHDFPDDGKAMEKDVGGRVPPSIRLARLVKRFAVGAAHVGKVAVVVFAEDWRKNVPKSTTEADALLEPRRRKLPGELPHAHLDVPMEELLRECPSVSTVPALVALAEEYEYPALVYGFVRSPSVHYGTSSNRTHGFTQGEEVFYMRLAQGTTIGLGVGVVTAWLRAAATNYAAHCTAKGVRPANKMDAGRQGEDILEGKWKLVAATT